MIAIRRRRPPRRGRATRWSHALRAAAVAVAVLGLVGSLLIARGWQTTVSRQRDERLRSLNRSDRYPGLQGIGWRTAVTDGQAVAFELFVPVYRGDESGDGVAERRRRFLGWATGQFRADDFRRAAMRTAPPFTGVELHDGQADAGSLVASYPEGFRAAGPDVRAASFTFGTRTFTTRYAPLPGNAILTERAIPAPLVVGIGLAISVLLGSCCGCWPRSAPSTTRSGAWPGPTP
jgi:hypothetical protein